MWQYCPRTHRLVWSLMLGMPLVFVDWKFTCSAKSQVTQNIVHITCYNIIILVCLIFHLRFACLLFLPSVFIYHSILIHSPLYAACSDLSLISGGNNQNIIQTIDQIIGIETAELQKVLDDGLNYGLPASSSSSSSSAISGTNELNSAISDAPRGYICPITLGLMR